MATTKRKTRKSSKPDPRPAWRAWAVKFSICVVLDIVDFTIGRIIGFGIVSNFALTIIGVGLFGWRGLIQLWEFIDPSHQIDGFVPTLSLIAWSAKPKGPMRF